MALASPPITDLLGDNLPGNLAIHVRGLLEAVDVTRDEILWQSIGSRLRAQGKWPGYIYTRYMTYGTLDTQRYLTDLAKCGYTLADYADELHRIGHGGIYADLLRKVLVEKEEDKFDAPPKALPAVYKADGMTNQLSVPSREWAHFADVITVRNGLSDRDCVTDQPFYKALGDETYRKHGYRFFIEGPYTRGGYLNADRYFQLLSCEPFYVTLRMLLDRMRLADLSCAPALARLIGVAEAAKGPTASPFTPTMSVEALLRGEFKEGSEHQRLEEQVRCARLSPFMRNGRCGSACACPSSPRVTSSGTGPGAISRALCLWPVISSVILAWSS